MIFVFPEADYQSFVMRDCFVPIDVLFLDDSRFIINFYTMLPEPPRTSEESKGAHSDAAYTARLKSYPSSAPCRYVIEIRGGRLAQLGVKQGDLVELDLARLNALSADRD